MRRTHSRQTHEAPANAGSTLLECLVYISLLMVVLGAGLGGFYRYLDHSRRLTRAVEDIARTLKAGERWRADVRSATGPLRLAREGGQEALSIPQGTQEIAYVFMRGDLLRVAGTQSAPQLLLEAVNSSRMAEETRSNVVAWRWEVELRTSQKKPSLKPLFTFMAVPAAPKQP